MNADTLRRILSRDWGLDPIMTALSLTSATVEGVSPPAGEHELCIDVDADLPCRMELSLSDSGGKKTVVVDIEAGGGQFTGTLTGEFIDATGAITFTPPLSGRICHIRLDAEELMPIAEGGRLITDLEPLRPYFPDDYEGAVSEGGKRDVVYVNESDLITRPQGIGYNCVRREQLLQVHVFGPDFQRGRIIRAEVERILFANRKRPDGKSLLFVERSSTRATDKRSYAYIYDIKTRKEQKL